MSNNYNANQDDATLPLQPPHPHRPVDQAGKLVVGSFNNPPPPRNPYQPPSQPPRSAQSHGQPVAPQAQPYIPPHNPQNPQGQPYMPPRGPQGQPPYGQPLRNPQGAYMPPAQPGQYNNAPPATYPRVGDYPNMQPGQVARPPRARRRKGRHIGCLATLTILLIVAIFAFVTLQRVLAFGSTISTQQPLSSQTGYMNTSTRTNLLIMGYGGGTHDGANLTDSMVIMSVMPQSHHTSLVAVPRDLWVQNPPNSGQYTKINAVYEFASQNGKNPATGGDTAAKKVSTITGMDVKYWLTINFDGFKAFIDSIGGVDVNVPDTFTSKYPANDDPNVNPNWTFVTFTKGAHHMDGNTAIQYARARYVTDNLAEASDFARSARQQLIMKAALSQIKQFSTWPKIYGALDALQKTIYTNMSLADLGEFALKMDLNDPKVAHVGLSVSNVLAYDTSNDGQSIIVPQNGNWQAIIDYVKQNLYN